MSPLFDMDPAAQIGWSPASVVYTDREDFHAKTLGAYRFLRA